MLNYKKLHDNKIILSEHEVLDRGNVMVLGDTWTGKTEKVILPNLKCSNCSYVVLDKAGRMYEETHKMFEANGYVVKKLNLLSPEESDHYNPLKYIGFEYDAEDLAKIITSSIKSSGDPFYKKAEIALTEALLSYASEFNMELPDIAELCDRDLEDVFDDEELECHAPYLIFKQASDKTQAEVIRNIRIRFQQFAHEDILHEDTMMLDHLNMQKMIIYIIFPTGLEKSVLIDMLVAQAMWETQKSEVYPFKEMTKFLLDDFYILGRDVEVLKAMQCMDDASFVICVKSIEELRKLYPESWEDFFNLCDATIFLGKDDDGKRYLARKFEVDADEMECVQGKCLVFYPGREEVIDDVYGHEEECGDTEKKLAIVGIVAAGVVASAVGAAVLLRKKR